MQDAFVGYQNDTPASVVFQATQQLQKEWNWSKSVHESSEKWKNGVLVRSKKILLQMASPDSMIRLKLTRLEKRETNCFKYIMWISNMAQWWDFLTTI